MATAADGGSFGEWGVKQGLGRKSWLCVTEEVAVLWVPRALP